MSDKTQIMVVSGVAVAAVAVTASILSKRSEAGSAINMRSASEIIASPPSPSELGLPKDTEFGSFANRRNISIHTMSLKSKLPPKKVKACAVFLHGIGDHSSRGGYGRLYKSLSDSGVDVYALDHQGHGLSEGERGYIAQYADFLDDAEDYCNNCISDYGGQGKALPIFLIGQSMGANIASHVALRLKGSGHQVAGLVLTSPAFGVDMNMVLKVQDFFGAFLQKVAPKAQLVDAVRPEDLSRDPEEVEKYRNDPLVHHGNLMVNTALCIKSGFESMEKLRGDISCPTLLLHGTQDHTTSLRAALDFFDNIGTKAEEKRMVRLVDFYHEVYNEKGKDAVIQIITSFVTSLGKELPNGDKPRSEGASIDSVIALDLNPT
mmetsp:Transcript_14042/g.30500  ORF Transcript_14042/g.30500 Transcript_14042/m.30500 type:complete len:377 (+) Transcript_14042:95-1225(+)